MERILVTGANRGLGLEFARQYAHAGARVFAGCREPASAGALREFASASDTLDILALDVTDGAAIDAAADHVRTAEDGHLDVLVNNAGVSPQGEQLDNLEAAAMLDVFSVNSVAPAILTQRFRPLLAQAVRPRVANVSSTMGSLAHKDYGRFYSYASSKAALNMITRAAAHDLAGDGIIVTALHPGWVQTDVGGPQAALTPHESVAGLRRVIDGLTLAQSGRFLAHDGSEPPW